MIECGLTNREIRGERCTYSDKDEEFSANPLQFRVQSILRSLRLLLYVLSTAAATHQALQKNFIKFIRYIFILLFCHSRPPPRCQPFLSSLRALLHEQNFMVRGSQATVPGGDTGGASTGGPAPQGGAGAVMRVAPADSSPTRRARKRAVGGVIDKLLSKVRLCICILSSPSIASGPPYTSCLILIPPFFPYIFVEGDASMD